MLPLLQLAVLQPPVPLSVRQPSVLLPLLLAVLPLVELLPADQLVSFLMPSSPQLASNNENHKKVYIQTVEVKLDNGIHDIRQPLRQTTYFNSAYSNREC